MDNTTKTEIKAQIKAKEDEFKQFSEDAQKELDRRNQDIQKAQSDLQALLRQYQSDVDRRAGAIESLKALVSEPKKNGKK